MTEPSKPVVDILVRARALIEPDGRWTQDAWARDSDGARVLPLDGSAVCWCPLGAIERAAAPDWNFRLGAEEVLRYVTGGWPINRWADAPKRTHPEILAGFDAAIERAKATGGTP
jgi:hypothetical protein